MLVNITDMKAGRTSAGNPKVNFVVWFCERDEAGVLEPRYSHEGWTLLRKGRKIDDRGVARTMVRLPQVPWVKWGDKFIGRYLTVNQIDDKLLDKIHEHVASLGWVQRWMGIATLEHKRKETEEIVTAAEGGSFIG